MGEEKDNAFLYDMHQAIYIPINNILGNSELILQEYVDLKVREYVMEIRTASYKLLSMANDFMDFSKLDIGALKLVEDEYDLQELLYELISFVRPRAAAKKLAFNFTLSQKIPRRLYGDRTRVKQILLKLLDNAVQFTSEGRVSLDVTCPYSDGGKTLLEFKVSDTGIGIHKGDIDKIFKGQKRESMGRSMSGSGLGLCLAKGLAQLMDGDVLVSSHMRAGSTFTADIVQQLISKEFVDQQMYGLDLHFMQMPFRADGARVLIIEDNLINAKVVYFILRRYGIEADIAESMPKVAALIQNIRYDLVFTDQGMLQMEGSDMIYIIREMAEFILDEPENFRKLPIISLIDDINDLSNSGIDDYVQKPVEIMEVERILRSWLPEAMVQYDTDFDIRAGRAPILDALGINYSAAIMNFNGNEDEYYEVLRSFHHAAAGRIHTLQQCLGEHDYKNFLISLRSLISISQVIGTEVLYYQAKVLEEICVREDYSLLEKATSGVLIYYQKTAVQLEPLIRSKKGNEKKDEISREELIVSIKELIDMIRDYRIEQAEQIFFYLAQRRFDDDSIMDLLHKAEEDFMSTYIYKDIIEQLTNVLGILRQR